MREGILWLLLYCGFVSKHEREQTQYYYYGMWHVTCRVEGHSFVAKLGEAARAFGASGLRLRLRRGLAHIHNRFSTSISINLHRRKLHHTKSEHNNGSVF
jgi:hypothetical protein